MICERQPEAFDLGVSGIGSVREHVGRRGDERSRIRIVEESIGTRALVGAQHRGPERRLADAAEKFVRHRGILARTHSVALCDPESVPNLIPPVVEPGTLGVAQQPTLDVDTELVLRPWHVSDAAAVLQAFSDPDIQHWHFRRLDSIDEAEAWIVESTKQWRSEQAASWAIASIPGNRVVGRVAVSRAQGRCW